MCDIVENFDEAVFFSMFSEVALILEIVRETLDTMVVLLARGGRA